MFKLNKNFILIFLLLNICNLIFALSAEEVRAIIIQKTSYSDTDIEKIYSINDKYSVVTVENIADDKHQLVFFVSNGKAESLYLEVQKDASDIKYLITIEGINALSGTSENINFVCGDFSFDEKCDICFLNYSDGCPVFEIYKIESSSKSENFNLTFPPAIYYLNDNSRIKNYDYINFRDFSFCIVKGKRGIRAFAMGDIEHSEGVNSSTNKNFDYYEINLEKTADSKYFFFYWDKSSQHYILDKSVTQEQLANAYCPEDYFAYNGLKFSKLDSKLTDEDLKDLDKAQLRLMRNAVYARHGRTFKSEDLQSLFDCYTWYKKNSAYSDNLLNETDKYNISLIQSIESKK